MRSETEAMVILSYTSNGNSPQNFDIEPISSSTAAAIKSFKFEIYMRFIFYDATQMLLLGKIVRLKT